MSDAKKYPEHMKLKAIKDRSQEIGSFIEWLQHHPQYEICRHVGNQEYSPAYVPIEKLLAEYFEIDLDELESEKRQMIEEIRKTNEESP